MAREAGSPPGSAAMVVARRRPRAVQARNVGRRSKRHALTIFVAPLLRGADWRSAPIPTHRGVGPRPQCPKMRHGNLAKRDSVQKLDSLSLREGHPARGKVNRWENLPLTAAGEGDRSGNLRAPAANLVGQALGEAGPAGNLDSPALREDSQWTKQDSPAAGSGFLRALPPLQPAKNVSPSIP